MNEINKISDCEELTMSVIWDIDHDMDLKEVQETVNCRYKKSWKPQTVSTFLTRLRKKGYLSMYRKGRYAYYQVVVTKEEHRKNKLCIEAERFYGGNFKMLIKDAMELGNITLEQLGGKE